MHMKSADLIKGVLNNTGTTESASKASDKGPKVNSIEMPSSQKQMKNQKYNTNPLRSSFAKADNTKKSKEEIKPTEEKQVKGLKSNKSKELKTQASSETIPE